ncbi:hypothetical protein [Candidatus Nitrotoga sp. AM1P]|uniref:hypothetical protein n=1 Tax=Candidatus Nitrotoga sp. AM1P TaxID=2559597 RepID=UPI0010B8C5A8|nr:hypothetical protein [Candidatus Nitrotoga sp. AM1P]BBJ22572.1 hypothetical protein W01_04990 [Candidatus Nitrotoga sp. AM1P]
MKFIKSLVFVLSLLFSLSSNAKQITVAAASDLKFALDEIMATFKKTNSGDDIDALYDFVLPNETPGK